jgi:hypothetical protein
MTDVGCWARKDDAPSWSGGEERGVLRDWLWHCGQPPADDFGLCANHKFVLILGDVGAAETDPGWMVDDDTCDPCLGKHCCYCLDTHEEPGGDGDVLEVCCCDEQYIVARHAPGVRDGYR